MSSSDALYTKLPAKAKTRFEVEVYCGDARRVCVLALGDNHLRFSLSFSVYLVRACMVPRWRRISNGAC